MRFVWLIPLRFLGFLAFISLIIITVIPTCLAFFLDLLLDPLPPWQKHEFLLTNLVIGPMGWLLDWLIY
jgi:hypothetical protein